MSERVTMDRLISDHAAATPDKPAVIDPQDRLTYAQLDDRSAGLAAGLIAAGVGKGTRVGLIMPNGTRWVTFAVAVTRIGAVLVPLSTLLTGPELIAQLHTAAVRYLIAVPEFRGHRYLDEINTQLATGERLPALRETWTPEAAEGLGRGAVTRDLVPAMAATVTGADLLAVLFTSGSSGPPKGTVHSHRSAFGAVASGLAARCVDADTRLYLPMPFFWVGGFGAGVLSALYAGATLVTEPIPEPESTLQLLAREQVTLFRGWPDQAESLARRQESVDADLSALRPGSLEALLPTHLRSRPGARANLFGMTEAFGPYCGYPADTDMPGSAWGSCGKPFEGMAVRITDPESGAPVGPDQPGMIEIRGPHVMRAICRRPRDETFTVDGYYRTGDLGRLDGEGFLFYHGRSDDMFKVAGATVYPVEVERRLRSVAGVRAAFVTNVADSRGQRVAALVVCETAAVTASALRSTLREQISSFKVPSVWLLVDEDTTVPRRATGKVDIPALRKLLHEKAGTTE